MNTDTFFLIATLLIIPYNIIIWGSVFLEKKEWGIVKIGALILALVSVLCLLQIFNLTLK